MKQKELNYIKKIEKKFLSEEEMEQLVLIRTYHKKINDANCEWRID